MSDEGATEAEHLRLYTHVSAETRTSAETWDVREPLRHASYPRGTRMVRRDPTCRTLRGLREPTDERWNAAPHRLFVDGYAEKSAFAGETTLDTPQLSGVAPAMEFACVPTNTQR